MQNQQHEVKQEVTNLLSELIRIDSTNPPGNETKAATWLAQNLTAEGFNCEIFESKPGQSIRKSSLKTYRSDIAIFCPPKDEMKLSPI